MKAVRAYKEHWEETNLLRLLYVAKLVNEKVNACLRVALILFEVTLYISYRACKGLYLFAKLLLLTESRLMKIERDETWIFRQIK
jgi:hypothetical protein